MKKNRECAYCGKNEGCRCNYKYMRMGKGAFSVHNTTRQSTFGEMKREFLKRTAGISPDTRGAWIFSLTEFDDKKIARADAKRS